MTRTRISWLLPGILCLAAFAVAQDNAWQKYIMAGNKAYRSGQYAKAEKQWVAALKEAEKFGQEDPRLATSLNNLAALYQAQSKYAKAEPLYLRALAIKEKALGAEHPDLVRSLNNLAALYRAQDKYKEAEPLYQRALAIREKALGKQHPDLAKSIDNLAELYHDMGGRARDQVGRARLYRKAGGLYRRALAIREKALGPQHLDVGQSLHNLAFLYYNDNAFKEAEPLYKRSLAISENAFGPQHPKVAGILENYAKMLRKTKRRDREAAKLEARAKAIRTKHPAQNPPR